MVFDTESESIFYIWLYEFLLFLELKLSKPSKKFDEEDEKEKEHSNKMVNSPKVQVRC